MGYTVGLRSYWDGVATAYAATGYYAKVVADSVVAQPGLEARITTVEARYPLYVHQELLTHRSLSRNASSNRARTTKAIIREVWSDPVVPVYWGRRAKGMQASSELDGWRRWLCVQLWLKARYVAIVLALLLMWLGLHKQSVNRLLSPWQWITVVITATEWDNFFALRCHPAAQPEMQTIATLIQLARKHSTPVQRDWHLPYIQPDEMGYRLALLIQLSVARSARVSYLTQGQFCDPAADLRLYNRLVNETPRHASPLEHVANAYVPGSWSYNLDGWMSWRYITDHGYADLDDYQDLKAA